MLIAVLLLRVTDFLGALKMPSIQKDVSKALIPLIAINVLGLGVNTICLVYVDTSFYQVCGIQHTTYSTHHTNGTKEENESRTMTL